MRKLILNTASWLAGRLPQTLVQRIYGIPPLARLIRRTLNRAAPQGFSRVEIAGGILAGCSIELDLQTEKDLWLGTYEPDLQDALRAFVKPGAVVYDVGANIGYVSLMCAKCAGETGRVFSFEPLPENQQRLARTLELNNLSSRVTLVKKAAGRESCRTVFWVHASTSMGRIDPVRSDIPSSMDTIDPVRSSIPPSMDTIDPVRSDIPSSMDTIDPVRSDIPSSMEAVDLARVDSEAGAEQNSTSGRGNQFHRAIEVDLVSLDDFIIEPGNLLPDVIKLDIEGGEVEALPGMRRLLREHSPLMLVEIHGTEAGRIVWEELTQAGYRLSWMRKGYPPVPGIEALQGKAYVVAQRGEVV